MIKQIAITKAITIMLFLVVSNSLSSAELKVLAGNGEAGFVDGAGADARFNKPIRLSPFGPGKVLVADIYNHALRVVSIDGDVKTIAGSPENKGHQDGLATEAKFNAPHGVAVSSNGVIAVADASNHVIRLLTPIKNNDYKVSTIAGVTGKTGFQDGEALKALFNSPHGLVWDAEGGLLVADIGNAKIRRIKENQVTTVLDAANSLMVMPIDIMPSGEAPSGDDASGEMTYLIADAGIQKALRFTLSGEVEILAPETELAMPHGVTGDQFGNVYVAELKAHQITRLSGNSSSRIAGTGEAGKSIEQLNKPAAVLIHDGYLWIADLNNHRISVIAVSGESH